MSTRGKVYGIINGERKYQDAQQEAGKFQKQVHTVGEELVLMKSYLDGAMNEYTYNYGDASALHMIRKVVALGVRCMENHGALPREVPESSNDAPDTSEKPEKPEEPEKEKEDEDEVPF